MGTSIRHTAIYQRRRGVNLAAAAVGLGAAYAWLGDTLPAVGAPAGNWVDVVGGVAATLGGTGTTSGTLAGQPCIVLNGSGRYVATFPETLAQPFSIVSVSRRTGATTSFPHIHDGLDASNRAMLSHNNTFQTFEASGGGAINGPATATATVVALVDYAGANGRIRINGAETTGNIGTNSIAGLVIGQRFNLANGMIGTIGALVIFPAATIANAATFAALAQQAYGITP